MSPRPRLANLAAKALQLEEGGFSPANSEGARAKRIDAIRGAIQRSARRKALRRLSMGTGLVTALAAAAAVVIMMRGHGAKVDAIAEASSGTGYVERAGVREAFASGVEIRSGDHLVADKGARLELALATGTRVTLESQGDLSVVSQDHEQVYWLAAGSMQARVSKLKGGDRFIVRTIDAEVEVRGTQFRVATAKADPACSSGSTTRVSVGEGVVLVRHAGVESWVAAGEEWPSGCSSKGERDEEREDAKEAEREETNVATREEKAEAATDSKPKASAPEPAIPNATAKRETMIAPPSRGKSSVPETSSELTAQNDLFARATDQKQAGDMRSAIATFELYLARYPQSALAESAAVERWRLLARVDLPQARSAAKAYLNKYPSGFARSDARAVIDRSE